MVIARHLLLRGARPVVCLVGDPRKITPDARTNFDAWVAFGGEVRELAVGGSLWALTDAMKAAAVVVDALFGTGLDRTIDGWLASVVGAVNDAAAPCVAVDLPSGLDADTGATLGVAVQARTTVTFAHTEARLLTPNGARLAGKVHVVDIGVPASVAAQVGSSAKLLETSDLAQWIERRAPGAHKTSAGHVLIVAGSPGKVGAPQLVARGAMRAGAGLATIANMAERCERDRFRTFSR